MYVRTISCRHLAKLNCYLTAFQSAGDDHAAILHISSEDPRTTASVAGKATASHLAAQDRQVALVRLRTYAGAWELECILSNVYCPRVEISVLRKEEEDCILLDEAQEGAKKSCSSIAAP